MRRLIHVLHVAVTLLSLVLFVGLASLWVRSYGGTDFVRRGWLAGFDSFSIRNHGQQLSVTRGQVRYTREEHTYYHHGHVDPSKLQPIGTMNWGYGRLGVGHINWEAPRRTFWERRGFAVWDSGWMSSFADSRDHNWGAPIWPAVALFAIPPVLAARRFVRRWRRHGAGRCAACGYDLRATPERCPECGTASSALAG